jgi:hypothetical protein
MYASTITSTMGCDNPRTTTPTTRVQLHHTPQLLVIRPHGLYINLAVRRDYSSPGCTGSTSPTSCTATTHLPVAPALYQQCRAPRLCEYSSPGCSNSTSAMSCVASTRLSVAHALLRLCRASGHDVLPLNFSSVGRTGSRRASGHCVSRRDYSSSGLHWLYCAYVVHQDAPY